MSTPHSGREFDTSSRWANASLNPKETSMEQHFPFWNKKPNLQEFAFPFRARAQKNPSHVTRASTNSQTIKSSFLFAAQNGSYANQSSSQQSHCARLWYGRIAWNCDVIGQSEYIAAVAIQAIADAVRHEVISVSATRLQLAESPGRTGAMNLERNTGGRY